MKKFILLLGAAPTILLIAVWTAFPVLLDAFEPVLARAAGLDSLQLVSGRPGWRGMEIHRLEAGTGSIRITAVEASLTYDWPGLMEGRLGSVDIAELHAHLDAPLPDSDPDPAQPFSLPRLPLALSGIPVERATISRMTITAPHLALTGTGQLAFAEARLSLSLSAQTPLATGPLQLELALQTPADGQEIHLEASLLEAGNSPTLSIQAIERDSALEVSARYHLQGFALNRLTDLAGLPPGEGLLQGEATARLDLDPTRSLDWASLQAEGPLALTWRSLDGTLRIDRLKGDIEYRSGDLIAQFGADSSLKLEDGSLRLELPDGLRLEANRERLKLASGARLDLRSGELSLHARLNYLEIPFRDPPAAILKAEVELRSPQVATGTVEASLSAPDDLPSHRAELSFSGSARLDDQSLPVALAGSYVFTSEALTADLALTSGPLQKLPIHLIYPLDGLSATVQGAHRLVWRAPLIAALLPVWTEDYDLDRGEMDLNFSFQLADTLTGSATFKLVDTTIHYGEYLGLRTEAELVAALRPEGFSFSRSTIKVGSLDVGFPVTGIETVFSGGLQTLQIESLKAQLLGGSATAEPFLYQIETSEADLSLTLADLDLRSVLALEGEDISGSGRLDGLLPVRIRNGEVSVAGGRIDARAPGGSIHLSPSLATAITQPGLDIALRALQDFQFTTLGAGVDYSASGDLNLSLRLEGRNPAVEKGRPIHYNLNISENIPTLLESLRLSDSFNRTIQERAIR